jgi:recombinational DNA repair ATPase RecF
MTAELALAVEATRDRLLKARRALDEFLDDTPQPRFPELLAAWERQLISLETELDEARRTHVKALSDAKEARK